LTVESRILDMAAEKDNERTADAVQAWWESAITEIAPDSIRVRGYAIEDLIGRISFPAMIWLTLRGELPSPRQAHLLGAVLVAGVDHGPQAPSIAIARMAITCGIGMNGAIASGVNSLGDVHGGAGQQCMELLAGIDQQYRSGSTLEVAVTESLASCRAAHGRFVPGFGHRFHRVDPRATRISQLMQQAVQDRVIDGRFLAIGEAVQTELSHGKTSRLPMNVDGISAVLLLELGFPRELGRGIFVLSRAVGICAHAYEQLQRGERIKGPIPPEFGFRYTGLPPRKVPGDGLP
jgi:citrate synthase